MRTVPLHTKLLSFFDRYILLIFTVCLIFFIPLYPKIPLFDIIPGYIVRVRAEDFFILIALMIYGVQILRKKAVLNNHLAKYVYIYLAIGLLSTLSGMFLTQTIPLFPVHIGKSVLHFLRYAQYFSLLFLAAASAVKQLHLRIITGAFIATVIAVALYGAGQKYLYWPVYSTMNREFSKGIVLYLTEHARVQSTFAGHYDMAAYLVLLSPLMLFATTMPLSKFTRVAAYVAFILSVWLITVSASRTSFVGFLVSLCAAIALLSAQKETLKKKFQAFARYFAFSATTVVFMFVFFGQGITERIVQTLEAYPIYTASYQKYQAFSDRVRTATRNAVGDNSFNITVEKPENGISVDQAAVIVSSDTRPTPIRPSDVYVEVPDKITVATISAEGVATTVVLDVPRNYSENALKHGLSLAIRLDTLWPQALQGFYTNPLFGTGYATLTKSSVEQFTEADSTDNNFLRTLGETGILGFISFYGIIALSLWYAYKTMKENPEDSLQNKFAGAFIAGSIGLLINALFIDVFAASKVAFTYWTMAGVLLAASNFSRENNKKTTKKTT